MTPGIKSEHDLYNNLDNYIEICLRYIQRDDEYICFIDTWYMN